MALLLAALIPAAAMTTYQLVHLTQIEQHGVEAEMLERADEVMALTNARLSADLAIAQTLAVSPSIDEQRFDVFQTLARRVTDQNAGWLQVVLVDAAKDQQVMNMLRPLSDLPLPAILDESYRRAKANLEPAIGGVFSALDGAGPMIVPLRVPVLREGVLRYILSIGIDARIFLDILKSRLPAEGVVAAGIVDRAGIFIARSRDPQLWVGKPASEFVRRAIASGPSGVYVGRLLEGFENYTAYTTSGFSGWSAHIALDAAVFDAPRRRSELLAAVSAFACLALGCALIFLVVRDRRDMRRAEIQLQQMQRLDALGKMTGGVAHDFNNLLAIIIGNVDLLRRRMGAALPPQIERIGQAAERGEKLIRQMLAFARRQPLNPQVVDLKVHIHGMRDLLKRATRGDISLTLNLAEDLWPVEVDPVQLESALLNLVINARDAMPNGGTLAIAARNLPSSATAPAMVEISVRDTGIGIPAADLARVFEPFFTTKPPGQGTGLGLSMVHGFVGQSGGRVEIASQVGTGTTVRLLLPRTTRPVERAAAASTGGPIADGRGRRILIVEDNLELSDMTTTLLRELGYVVDQAEAPAEALARLASSPADLVFSDILMPGGLNGVQFAREVRRRYPGTKVLLTSGDAGASGAVDPREFTILQKPYHLDALTKTIRRMLDTGRTADTEETASA